MYRISKGLFLTKEDLLEIKQNKLKYKQIYSNQQWAKIRKIINRLEG